MVELRENIVIVIIASANMVLVKRVTKEAVVTNKVEVCKALEIKMKDQFNKLPSSVKIKV